MRSFVPSMLFLLILAAILRIDFYFAIVYFLVAIYALARLWLHRAFDHVEVTRSFDDRAFSGETVDVEISLRNTGLLPVPWMELRESTAAELTGKPFPEQAVSLGPHERLTTTYTLLCRRRGYYEVGPLHLVAGDLLDIERRRVSVPEPRRLIVYPKIIPLSRPSLPSRSALVAVPARNPLFEDPSRITGVRDYRRGDSPRRIHWTASARTGQLLVKQFQPAIARETLICLDLDADAYESRGYIDSIEMAIVVAASVANAIISDEKLPAGLLTEAIDPIPNEQRTVLLPPRREQTHLMGILEALARVKAVRGVPIGPVIRRERFAVSWGSTILLITGRGGGDIPETVALLKRAGLAVSVVLVRPPGPADAMAGRWSSAGVPVRRIWTESELAAWS